MKTYTKPKCAEEAYSRIIELERKIAGLNPKKSNLGHKACFVRQWDNARRRFRFFVYASQAKSNNYAQ